MKKILLTLVLVYAACAPQEAQNNTVASWEQRAQNVTIIRDDWGIPHIYGETDADAVFGMIYAQAEDDFNRIELNFLNSQGRLAEAEGEVEIWRDLRMKLFIDPEDMRAQYRASPVWLRDLMDAWSDGLNYYLYTHPEVTPKVLTRFEPWMALTFSEGSIGGDIERVSLSELEAFYGHNNDTRTAFLNRNFKAEPTGSNGFAIAPSNSASGNALLLINPHTSFFFRAEVHMVSNQGLDAYGAVTWGQFFVYQGFNEGSGWMHTSSGVDNIDEYLETIVERDGSYFYIHGDEERPVTKKEISVPYRTDAGMAERQFTVYRTHHGPIVRQVDSKWVSVSLMEEPMDALNQSYSRTKARNYEEFRQTMELHTNSSNNTVFADSEGNIAYFHSNFIPRRDTSFDWNQPVDGSDPATDWQGVHAIDETPNVLNPENGWIQNTNNWPYSAAGPNSPRQEDYPIYMQRRGENARGLHAIRVLESKSDFDLQSLIDAAYDSYLTGFEELIPALVRSYDQLPLASPLKNRLSEQITVLRDWDLRYSAQSIPTSLAIFWGEELRQQLGGSGEDGSAEQYLRSLATASDQLEADFGTWRTPWGEINRFQRLTGDIVQPFDDTEPSFPVEFASGRWGSLASFGARAYPQTKKWYGTSGNSFVAVIEFGDQVRARAITAGGLNSKPESPHFKDQTERYATGNLRDVYYYRADLEGHIEREYHPGG